MNRHIKALRDKYLPAAFLVIAFAINGTAQVYQQYNQYGGQWKRLLNDSTQHIPEGNTPSLRGGSNRPGALFYKTTDSAMYVWTGYSWYRGAKLADTTLYLATKTDLLSAGGGGLTGGNVGSGYRFYLPGSQAMRSFNPGFGLLADTADAGQLRAKIDSLNIDDADSLAFARKWVGWGDSNTEIIPGWLERLTNIGGMITLNRGISGQNSTQIKNRMIADPERFDWSVIIWAGSNNVSSPATVMANVKQMVDSIKHNRYLVLSVHDVSNAGTGAASNDSMHVINDSLELVYGDHFLNIRDSLYNSYNPSIPADVTAYGLGKLPPSLMANSGADPAHMNTAGYHLIAGWIYKYKRHILYGTQYKPKIAYASQLPMAARAVNTYSLWNSGLNNTNVITVDSAGNPTLIYQTHTWNGSAFIASESYGIGRFALQQNRGNYAQGFGPWAGRYNTAAHGVFVGYNAGGSNTGSMANFFGNNAGSNNTGANSTGMGHGALTGNTGASVTGMGTGVLGSNTGANSIGIGSLTMQLNSGANSIGIGNSTLLYNIGANSTVVGNLGLRFNNWGNRTHLGYNDLLTDWVDDAATNKTFTEASITSNNITVTSHGYGANGTKVSLKYTVLSGGPISIFTTGSVYQFTIVDANTLSYSGLAGATKPAGSYQLNKDADRTNSTSLGYAARATKSNQVMLGNSSVTEVTTAGKLNAAASTYSSGGYDVLVRNQTTGDFEKYNADLSAIGSGGGGGTSNANIGSGYRILLPGTQEIKTLYAGTNVTIDSTTNANGLTISASGGGGSGTDNANTGSGYRWLKPADQTVKTAFEGYGITWDSTTNTNGLTAILDTATVFPAVRATIPAGGGGGEAYNDDILAYRALGASFIAEAVGQNVTTATFSSSLADGQIRYIPVYIRTAQTVTGVRVFMRTQGSYTADNNNKMGLYSYSGGTMTKVAETADDGNMWKATGNSWIEKLFSSSYSASPGIYFIAILYNNSAQTTAPAIAAGVSVGGASQLEMGFTSSAKMYSAINSQTDLPSTQAMSGVTTLATLPYAALIDYAP